MYARGSRAAEVSTLWLVVLGSASRKPIINEKTIINTVPTQPDMESSVPGRVEANLRLVDADVRNKDEDVPQNRKGEGCLVALARREQWRLNVSMALMQTHGKTYMYVCV